MKHSPPFTPSSRTHRASSRIFLAGSIAAVVGGIAHAWWLRWITDDAWISFRYAERLVQGLGLTFNDGERVEGYSNFLWTMWCAVGIALGVRPDAWSITWGIACHGTTIALLAAFAWRRAAAAAPQGGAVATVVPGLKGALPIAALLMALHRDHAIFATSGLETSLFTLLAVVGFMLVLNAPGRPRRAAVAGFVLGLGALTRPDGVLLAAIAGAYLLLVSRRRLLDGAAFAAPLAALIVPFLAWKIAYYGDILPNTYYAKSANRAWYSQGLAYVGLYFRKYWVLPVGALACGLALMRARPILTDPRDGTVHDEPAGFARTAGLAAAFAVIYTLYVAHVGGDFMYARLLIPTTPFWLILLQLAVERWVPARMPHQLGVAAALGLAILCTPYPFKGQGWTCGIVNVWVFYPARERERAQVFGGTLRVYFDGLPVRMAFCGGQAVLAYLSRAPIAIETATGLTDSTIAHQPLAQRGRVGHEKMTPIPYLIARRTHFWMYSGKALSDTLAPYIPLVPIQFDTLTVMAMTWDPPVMDALRERGVKVPDFLATLDQFIAAMPVIPDDEVRAVYRKTQAFYFDHVPDPAREAPFRARLGIAGAVGQLTPP